jgi:fibronectin type 3 domain-containing protein
MVNTSSRALKGCLPALFLVLAVLGCDQTPSAPGKLHSVTITWKASVSKVNGYHVYRSDGPDAPPGLLAAIDADATQYVDRGAEAGHTYYYSVKSVGVDGTESLFSDKVAAKIPRD